MDNVLSQICFWVVIILQDEDFVAEKDDEGSPTDDSGEEDSDASESGDEARDCSFLSFLCACHDYFNHIIIY